MGLVSLTVENENLQKKNSKHSLLVFHNLSNILVCRCSSESDVVRRAACILCNTVAMGHVVSRRYKHLYSGGWLRCRLLSGQALERWVTTPPAAIQHFIETALAHSGCATFVAATRCFAWCRYASLYRTAIVCDTCSAATLANALWQLCPNFFLWEKPRSIYRDSRSFGKIEITLVFRFSRQKSTIVSISSLGHSWKDRYVCATDFWLAHISCMVGLLL